MISIRLGPLTYGSFGMGKVLGMSPATLPMKPHLIASHWKGEMSTFRSVPWARNKRSRLVIGLRVADQASFLM